MKHREKILNYFDTIKISLQKKADEAWYSSNYKDLLKQEPEFFKKKRYMTIMYFNMGCIDHAIYDFKKEKFIRIEYPWMLKNGDVIYKKIKL
jgi:hypothetical protein